MLNQDYTAKLLNLEDVIITNVENLAEELHVYIELPRKEHTCPACGSVTDRVHDYRMQTVKDIPLARNTFLHLRKRRYRCACGKRFFEGNTILPRYYRVTSRLVAEVIRAFEKVAPAKEIGCRFNVSGATAMRYFRCVNHKPKELPEVVSLDEFKGNSGGQKYNSIVADPKNHKVIDILPNRYENDLITFQSCPSASCFINACFACKSAISSSLLLRTSYIVDRPSFSKTARISETDKPKEPLI
ncbi:MAG: transposase family protein [Clostridiales bacterium]|nr:transposase family protein [Clostridiales bacterium]MDY4111921.1 transposase family protein [Roseburia sp.]